MFHENSNILMDFALHSDKKSDANKSFSFVTKASGRLAIFRIPAALIMREADAEGRSIPEWAVMVRPFSAGAVCILNPQSNKGGFRNMGKRVICLICAAVLAAAAFFGIRTEAGAWNVLTPVSHPNTGLHLAKGIVRHAPNPLVSAMFLILAGIGISMLFDKRNKR